MTTTCLARRRDGTGSQACGIDVVQNANRRSHRVSLVCPDERPTDPRIATGAMEQGVRHRAAQRGKYERLLTLGVALSI